MSEDKKQLAGAHAPEDESSSSSDSSIPADVNEVIRRRNVKAAKRAAAKAKENQEEQPSPKEDKEEGNSDDHESEDNDANQNNDKKRGRRSHPQDRKRRRVVVSETSSDEDEQKEAPAKPKKAYKAPKKASHAPRLTRGDRPINDGTIDRAPAKKGKMDLSKLVVSFPTERDDPKNPGQVIPGDKVTYKYEYHVDWNSKESVAKLNRRRTQWFYRTFGCKRPTRVFWLEMEQRFVLRLLEKQLDRHRRPLWRKLANRYNEHFRGKKQEKGSKLVSEKYKTVIKSGKKEKTIEASEGGTLDEDRNAPWRTASAIQGSMFRWPKGLKLLEDAKSKEAGSDTPESSSSEESNEDANPFPAKPAPRRSQKQFKGKGKAKEEVVQDDDDDDDDDDLTCPFCGELAASLDERAKHIRECDKNPENRTAECPDCGKDFESQADLDNHRRPGGPCHKKPKAGMKPKDPKGPKGSRGPKGPKDPKGGSKGGPGLGGSDLAA